jgi:hypothetical protein
MQREIVKPNVDVPLKVRLDQGPEGQQKQGQYGIDYQYTVNHDSGVMWLPLAGREALLKSGAQAGDDVEIVKILRGKAILFAATVVRDAHERQQAPVASAAPIRPNGQLPARAFYQPEAADDPARLTDRDIQIPRVSVTPARSQAPLSPVAQQLAGTLCAAVDAAAEAEAYARGKGLSIQFTADDIRAIGLSIYIGTTRQQGQR